MVPQVGNRDAIHLCFNGGDRVSKIGGDIVKLGIGELGIFIDVVYKERNDGEEKRLSLWY